MMIDQGVFKQEWLVLCERWNKQPSVQLTARYYQTLTDNMDTASFQAACRVVFAENEFFPTPSQFMQATRSSEDVHALDQWELCLRVMEGEPQIMDRMNAEGQRAVALLGGPARLGNTPIDSVPFVRRDFLAFYHDVSEGVVRGQLLPEAEITPESRRIVGELMSLPKGAV